MLPASQLFTFFGIGDLLGRKVGQVTTHAQLKWRTVLFPTASAS